MMIMDGLIYKKDNTKKTIFIVINSLYGGGAEHVAAKLTKKWTKLYNIVIFSLTGTDERDYDFFGEIVSLDAQYKGISIIDKAKKCAKYIDVEAKKHAPIVIIGFLQNANLCVAQMKYPAKKIVSIRNYLDRQYSGYKLLVWKYLIKKYFKNVDKIVSVSKKIDKEMMQSYGMDKKKCISIYNPYDNAEISRLKEEEIEGYEKYFIENHIVISNMGHLSKQKGQFHLIRIVPELKKRYPNIGIMIIGNDNSDYALNLKSMVSELGIEKDVLFTGIKKNPYSLLSRSDIFVFPSLYEGFPNALIEAMHCNIPVIATDCKTGPREILEPNKNEKCGFIVRDNQKEWEDFDAPLDETEKEIINCVQKLLEDELLYNDYVSLAKERVKQFSYDVILPQWFKLFEI